MAQPDNVYTLVLETEEGDFYCINCQRLCSMGTDRYCCDRTRELSIDQKTSEAAFMCACVNRTAMNRIVQELVKNHIILEKDGTCFFCFTDKDHAELKCLKMSRMFRFAQVVERMEKRVHRYLEIYTDLRKKARLAECDTALKKAQAITEDYINENVDEDVIDDALSVASRSMNASLREVTNRIDEENAATVAHVENDMVKQRRENYKLIQDAEPQNCSKKSKDQKKEDPTLEEQFDELHI